MELTGQYETTHLLGTVTKNLIYTWPTFTNEAGEVLAGGDAFEIVVSNLPHGSFYATWSNGWPPLNSFSLSF
jgi:hypothetical protein